MICVTVGIMDVFHIGRNSEHYPRLLVRRLGSAAAESMAVSGRLDILRNPLVGLICSVRCPGSVVIKTFAAIRRLRDEKIVFVGGFHSPMERDCLDLLLRGDQPAILCPARSLRNLRMGVEARKAVSEGRLLVLSFFGEEIRRTTANRSEIRLDLNFAHPILFCIKFKKIRLNRQ